MNWFYLLLLTFLYLQDGFFAKEIVVRFGQKDEGNHENRLKRQVLIHGPNQEQYRWPNNTVHFYFDEKKFDFKIKDSIIYAMELISNHTCIKFSTEYSDVMIRMESDPTRIECFSAIGHIQDNQPFSFTSDCFSAGLAVHELIHSLGFIHSHQRSDRDQYLQFELDIDNMSQLYQDQYRIFPNQDILVPYDYGSIMQYPDRNGEYFPVWKNRKMVKTMGSEIVAYYDYLMINKYYECSCGDNNTLKCKNYGYNNPSNCSQCNCPLGFGGVDCSERPEPGASLTATEDWQNFTISLDTNLKNPGTRGRQINFVYHYLWITAPTNKTTEVRVEKFNEEKCVPGCIKGGIEIKTNEDPRLTSQRLCCDERRIQRSRNTPTIVMTFNSEGLDEYNISYRYV